MADVQGCGGVRAACLLALVLLATAVRLARADPYEIVVLQSLDKVAARVSLLDVPVGSTVGFGSLKITARSCDKRPPEETPESAAFLEIVEERPDEAPTTQFSGWMFASSPALSAMEHPVYDVWVIDCKNSDSAASETVP